MVMNKLQFQTTSSAVNQIDVTNAATGNNHPFHATGDDSNIDLNLVQKELVDGAILAQME